MKNQFLRNNKNNNKFEKRQSFYRNKWESSNKSKEEGFNLLEFVRFFLNVIDHEEVETLYLSIALVDFFKEISQLNGFKERILFVDITNYICNVLNTVIKENSGKKKRLKLNWKQIYLKF